MLASLPSVVFLANSFANFESLHSCSGIFAGKVMLFSIEIGHL